MKNNNSQIDRRIYFHLKIDFLHFEQNELMNDYLDLMIIWNYVFFSGNSKLKLLRRIFNSSLIIKSVKATLGFFFFNLKEAIMKNNDFRLFEYDEKVIH